MVSAQQRLASQIARELYSVDSEDRGLARKVARYLLGVDSRRPDVYDDDILIDEVKSKLRAYGYHPPRELGLPWVSPWT